MSHKTKTSVLFFAVILVLLLAPQNGDALTQTFYRQGEYERLGRVVDSQKFGKTMLAMGDRVQFLVKIVPDPQVRQAWPLRSPYTNTACAAYYAESYDETKGQVGHLGYSDSAAARIWAQYENYAIELPTAEPPEELFFHLKTSYGDMEGNRYRLTPIETRDGSVVKREWCLEPDKTYTLAILDFGGPLPPGPNGKVEYFSAFHFYFTDPIPEDQLARAEEEVCPPHYIRDEPTGGCIRPITTTPSPLVPSLSRIWILIRVALGLTVVGLVLLVVWYFSRYHKNR